MIITEQIREQLLKQFSEGGVSVDFSIKRSKKPGSLMVGRDTRMQGSMYTDLGKLAEFIEFCIDNSSIGKKAIPFSPKLEIPEIGLIVDTAADIIALQRELNQIAQVSQNNTISGKLTELSDQKEFKESGEILQTSGGAPDSLQGLGRRFQTAGVGWLDLDQVKLTDQEIQRASLQFSSLSHFEVINKPMGSVTELETHQPEKSSPSSL